MAAETAVFAVRSAKPCFSWASCDKFALVTWQACYIVHSACFFSTKRVVCCFSSEHQQKSHFLVIHFNSFTCCFL